MSQGHAGTPGDAPLYCMPRTIGAKGVLMPALSIKDTVRLILSGETPVAYRFDKAQFFSEDGEFCADKVTVVFAPVHGNAPIRLWYVTPELVAKMAINPLCTKVIRYIQEWATDKVEYVTDYAVNVSMEGDTYLASWKNEPAQLFNDFPSLGKYLLGLPIWDNQPWE